jgi:hypothetical protein
MALRRIPCRDECKSVVLNRFFRISPQPELLIDPCARATISSAEHGMMNKNSNLTLRVGFGL